MIKLTLAIVATALIVSACGTAAAGEKYAGITSSQARSLAIQDFTKMEVVFVGQDPVLAHSEAVHLIGSVKQTVKVVCNGKPYWKVGHVYESLKTARFGCNDVQSTNGYTTYFTLHH